MTLSLRRAARPAGSFGVQGVADAAVIALGRENRNKCSLGVAVSVLGLESRLCPGLLAPQRAPHACPGAPEACPARGPPERLLHALDTARPRAVSRDSPRPPARLGAAPTRAPRAQLLAHRSCGELVGFYYGVWKQRAHPRARAWYHRLALVCSPAGICRDAGCVCLGEGASMWRSALQAGLPPGGAPSALRW